MDMDRMGFPKIARSPETSGSSEAAPEEVVLKINAARELWYEYPVGTYVKLKENEAATDERDRQHENPDSPPVPGFPKFNSMIEDAEIPGTPEAAAAETTTAAAPSPEAPIETRAEKNAQQREARDRYWNARTDEKLSINDALRKAFPGLDWRARRKLLKEVIPRNAEPVTRGLYYKTLEQYEAEIGDAHSLRDGLRRATTISSTETPRERTPRVATESLEAKGKREAMEAELSKMRTPIDESVVSASSAPRAEVRAEPAAKGSAEKAMEDEFAKLRAALK